MDRVRQIRLRRIARNDLANIYQYTAERWSPVQAERYSDALLDAIDSLAAGTIFGRDAEIGLDILRYRSGSHIIFFTQTATVLEVVRVLHVAMDPGRHLDE